MYQVTLTQSLFPAQADDVVRETTVPSLLLDAARDAPNAQGLIEANAQGEIARRWTYRQLLTDVERLAGVLAAQYAPGERIAVWAPNAPEWVVLEFAAGLAGLTLVTVNPAYQARELRFVLEQSRSAGLYLTRNFRGNPMIEIARRVAAEIPAIRHLVDIEDAEALFGGAPARALPTVGPGDAAQIQYTSGTTGFPKGAVLTHRGLTNNARLSMARAGVVPGDVGLNPMPMFHTSGCGIVTLGTMQNRMPMILIRQFDPDRVNALIEGERVGMMGGVPTMLLGMLEALARNPRDVSSIRSVFSGGAMVPPELVRRVNAKFGCNLSICYGQTECSAVLTQTGSGDALQDQFETAGQPLPKTEVSIRDPATGAVVAVGAVGEICSRSYGTMIAYNDNPKATAEAVDGEGWLHTGDLGTMDARGYLRITGRVKEMIIRGGENLFPAEIENQMLEHPAIAEIAVVGVPDDTWGEIAVCFFRAVPGALPSRAELVAHCRRDLAAQKTPAHWIPVDAFPLTGSGKIQKFVLREKFIAGEFPDRL
ncbi:MAG TPA: AMP-binding protein [Rhizomicrobium sp.]|jgi:fatty-acyl-CoA synthase|nr:AMP-binding protein [Rhizomicrobium sp.]